MAVDAIAQDEFSQCFEPKRQRIRIFDPLPNLTLILDITYRYLILFPIRLSQFLLSTLLFFLLLPLAWRLNIRWLKKKLFYLYCRAWTRAFGAEIRHHGKKPVLNEPHIFVANHTSIIDFFVLSSHEFSHATIAQQHKGIMGWLQTYVLSLNGSLMFHRSDKKDRSLLANKMKNHVFSHVGDSPLLVFPEGTCVNNEYTVLFHKGAFSLDSVVCPVAVKYNKEFGDPYWMSSRQSFLQHIFYLMTRKKLKADVWWLAPVKKGPNELPSMFADRVKKMISVQAGLRCVSWDGYMKNFFTLEKRNRLKDTQQSTFASGLKRRMSTYVIEGDSESFVPSIAGNVLTSTQLVTVKNTILVDLESNLWTRDDIASLSQRQEGIVKTWKKYTRLKDDSDETTDARRLENSSWRLWGKKQIMKDRTNDAEDIPNVQSHSPRIEISSF